MPETVGCHMDFIALFTDGPVRFLADASIVEEDVEPRFLGEESRDAGPNSSEVAKIKIQPKEFPSRGRENGLDFFDGRGNFVR